jgi:RNA polymerase sigma-70 factor (ECF subfamily)
MSQRHVHVIHVLAVREERGARQVLLYPHRSWSAPDTGRPFLSVPSKKIAMGDDSTSVGNPLLRRTLAAVLRDDLGLPARRPDWEARRPRATLELCSPTRRVPTTYAVWPVVVPIDPAEQDALCARLGGEWLSERDALRRPYLSPTARRALGGDGATAAAAAEAIDDWTLRLVAVRAGDVAAFGPLFEEMTPWLIARLRACPWTRGLAHRPEDVEDTLHDAALNALTHLDRFNPGRGSAATWLWAVSRNVAVSRLRRRGTAHAAGWDDSIADPGADPAALSEEREEWALAARLIERALEQCGPLVRRAWELRHRERRPYAVIAAEMRQPIGTVATWIHRVTAVARGLAGRAAR